MSGEVRENEIIAHIMRGNQSFNVVLSAGVRAILLLLQHLHRMHREKLLMGGEVENFERFVKATGGRFDIVNVPIADGDNAAFAEFKKNLDDLKVRYHILPDLDGADKRIQICVFQPDAGRFAGSFKEYIQKQLSGGELLENNLLNLTEGQASLVSVQGEERKAEIQKDFDNLKINYAVMPDLKVGDGKIQFLVANHDIPRLKQWYRLYQQDMLKAGKAISDLRAISLDEYQATADMSAEDYINTSTPELKARLEKYQTLEKGEFERAVDELENQVRQADTYTFEKFLKSTEYEMVSVDHKTLVEPVDTSSFPETEKENFICRIPGTFGEDARYLSVPKEQVFLLSMGGRDRYFSFVKSEEPPTVLDAAGKKVSEFATGRALMEHFDRVRETLDAEKLEKVAEVARQLSGDVPLPNPVLAK